MLLKLFIFNKCIVLLFAFTFLIFFVNIRRNEYIFSQTQSAPRSRRQLLKLYISEKVLGIANEIRRVVKFLKTNIKKLCETLRSLR